MAEEQKFDPRDLNQDGKVTLKEKVQYGAKQAYEKLDDASEKLGAVADAASAKAKEVYADAKVKGAEFAGKAKEVYADAKVKGAEFADKAKDAYGKAKDKAEELGDKAEAKIEEIKAKKCAKCGEKEA